MAGTSQLLLLLNFLHVSSGQGMSFAEQRGIPVPGQAVSPMDVFSLMSASCLPKGSQDYSARDIIANSLQMLRGGETGERIGQRMLENLAGGVGEIELGPMMGRWIRVLQSASLAPGCVRTHFTSLSSSPYSGVFTSTSYHSLANSAFDTSHGYGVQIGPGPARTLVFPHDDPCPYVVVKRGPINDEGQYEYLILSQFLKSPLIGLARDPMRFEKNHRGEVETFLRTSGFLNPFAPASSAIAYTDFASCPYDSHAPFG